MQANLTPIDSGSSNKIATISCFKADSTDGGTFTGGSWQTRELNTISDHNGMGVVLSSNQFTLPAGNYYIDGFASVRGVNSHQARIRNITDGSTAIVGSREFASSTVASTNSSQIRGFFTIAATKTFELQHRCSGTKSNDGFGVGGSVLGEQVLFSQIKITKIN